MALDFSGYKKSQYAPLQNLLKQEAMTESFKQMGKNIGTALSYGAKEYGGLTKLASKWRDYKDSGLDPETGEAWAENKGPLSFEKWKKSSSVGGGLEARDLLKQDKKWGGAAHEKFTESMRDPREVKYNTLYEELMSSGNYEEDEAHTEAEDQLGYGIDEVEEMELAPGAFTNWLKSDEGKGFKRAHRFTTKIERKDWGAEAKDAYKESLAVGEEYTDVGFKDYMKRGQGRGFVRDWKDIEKEKAGIRSSFAKNLHRDIKRDRRQAKRQEFFKDIGTGIDKFGQGVQKIGQTIIPGGETGYINAPYGGILGKLFTPRRHDIRKTAATGGFEPPPQIQTAPSQVGTRPSMGGQVQPIQMTVPASGTSEEKFADWYNHIQGLSNAEYERLPLETKTWLQKQGAGRGIYHSRRGQTNLLEKVIEKRGW